MQTVRTGLLAVALVIAAFISWVIGGVHELLGISPWIMRSFIVLLAGTFIAHLARLIRQRRDFERMMTPTGIYGQGRIADQQELSHSEFAGPLTGDSFIIGAVGDMLLHYVGPSHIAVIGPNASGKSESLGVGNALHIKHNIVVTDKGGEIALRTLKHRAERLRQSVAVINPWQISGLPNHHFNPLQIIVWMVMNGDTDFIDVVRSVVHVLKPEPKQSGDNVFFREGARDLLTWLIVALAYWEATTGEIVCNLPTLFDIVCGSQADLEIWLSRMRSMEEGEGLLASAANRLASRLSRSPKTFENILAEAQMALAIYDRLSPLGRSMEYSDFDPRDLKRKPMSIYIAAPPEKLYGSYASWIGLVVDSLLRAGLAPQKMHPRITYLLDEFANLSPGPLPSILPVLYVGRSAGCRVVTFVQDRRAYERYGAESSAFITQAEVTIIFGIRDPADAEWVEKRAGQSSVMTETATAPGSDKPQRIGFSVSEKPLPVIGKHDAMSLSPYTAIAFLKNTAPVIADLISYRSIDPLAGNASTLDGDNDRRPLPIKFKL